MRVVIDEDRCIACQACEAVCDKVFRAPKGRVAEIVAQPDSECWACVEEAAAGCPQGAIKVVEREGDPG